MRLQSFLFLGVCLLVVPAVQADTSLGHSNSCSNFCCGGGKFIPQHCKHACALVLCSAPRCTAEKCCSGNASGCPPSSCATVRCPVPVPIPIPVPVPSIPPPPPNCGLQLCCSPSTPSHCGGFCKSKVDCTKPCCSSGSGDDDDGYGGDDDDGSDHKKSGGGDDDDDDRGSGKKCRPCSRG